MDLPLPASKILYNRHLKEIEDVLRVDAENKMNDAAARLLEITKAEAPSKLIRLEGGQEVAQIAVTVDGTWQ